MTLSKANFSYRYTLYRVWSGGRGKIKTTKITGFPRLYENMSFLDKYDIRDDEIVILRITKKRGSYQYPFSKNQVKFNRTFKEFKEWAKKKAFEKRRKRQFPPKLLKLAEKWAKE
jgi:hypothetical protein